LKYLAQWHQKQDITYAASHFKEWKSTKSEELYIFFAVIMLTVKMKKLIREYSSIGPLLATHKFSELMLRDQCLLLQLSNNEQQSAGDGL
jgi:hypothetical protein